MFEWFKGRKKGNAEGNNYGMQIMRVKQTFRIDGSKTVVLGTVEQVSVSKNDLVEIVNENGDVVCNNVSIQHIERANRLVKNAVPGETVGIMLNTNYAVRAGMLLIKQ